MKKWILGIGSSVALVPISVAVSCGSADTKFDLKKNKGMFYGDGVIKNLTKSTYKLSNPDVGTEKLDGIIAKLPKMITAEASSLGIEAKSNTFADPSKTNPGDKFTSVEDTASWEEYDWVKYYANLNVVTPSSNSKYFRWKQTVNKSQIEEVLTKNLKSRVERVEQYTPGKKTFLKYNTTKRRWEDAVPEILKLGDGESYTGKIKSFKVSQRAKGGVVQSIVIVGEKNTLSIATEYNIRFIFNFSKSDTKGISEASWNKHEAPFYFAKGPMSVFRKNEDGIFTERIAPRKPEYNSGQIFMFDYVVGGGIYNSLSVGKTGIKNGVSTMRSGYFAIYENNDELTFYGGGFGHGVGLQQWGASQLAYRGWSYDQMLKHYYNRESTDIKNITDPTKKAALNIEDIVVAITTSDTQNAGSTDISYNTATIAPQSGDTLIWKSKDGTEHKFVQDKEVTITSSGTVYTITDGTNTFSINKADATPQTGQVIDGSWGIKSKLDKPMKVPTLKSAKYWAKGKLTSDGQKEFVKDSGNKIMFEAPEYPGTIIPFFKDGKTKTDTANNKFFSIANKLRLNDYIERVIPSEMPSAFGEQALAAQAVAARSYAVATMISKGKVAAYGVHVIDNTSDQVYNRLKPQPWEKNEKGKNIYKSAATQTNNKYLLDNKFNPVNAKYAAVSAGYSSSLNDVWSQWDYKEEPVNHELSAVDKTSFDTEFSKWLGPRKASSDALVNKYVTGGVDGNTDNPTQTAVDVTGKVSHNATDYSMWDVSAAITDKVGHDFMTKGDHARLYGFLGSAATVKNINGKLPSDIWKNVTDIKMIKVYSKSLVYKHITFAFIKIGNNWITAADYLEKVYEDSKSNADPQKIKITKDTRYTIDSAYTINGDLVTYIDSTLGIA